MECHLRKSASSRRAEQKGASHDRPLLQVHDLHVRFPISGGGLLGGGKRTLCMVNGISFELAKGECLSLVGESGCGKSTTALSILGIAKAIYLFFRCKSQKDRMDEGISRSLACPHSHKSCRMRELQCTKMPSTSTPSRSVTRQQLQARYHWREGYSGPF